jgi:hypothetical protein
MERTIAVGAHTGEDIPFVATHVLDVVGRLSAIDPFRAFIAANVITNSLGYISLNANLWDMRKNAQTRKLESQADELGLALCDLGNGSNTIDRYNEWRKEETLSAGLETGPTPLPKVDGKQLLGVYKGMLTGQLIAQFPQKPSMPQDILAQITTPQAVNVDAIIDELNKQALEKAGLSSSLIDAARAKRAAASNTREQQKVENETKAMIELFKITATEAFTDDHWEALPVWKQYQFLYMVYRQIMSAIGNAMADIERGIGDAQTRFDQLVDLGAEIRVELITMYELHEVRRAFNEDKLNASYGIE